MTFPHDVNESAYLIGRFLSEETAYMLMKTLPKPAGSWWHLGPAVQRISTL